MSADENPLGSTCEAGYSLYGKSKEYVQGPSLKWKQRHSVSKSNERGRMLHEMRKEKKSWQNTESLEEHLPKEKHY